MYHIAPVLFPKTCDLIGYSDQGKLFLLQNDIWHLSLLLGPLPHQDPLWG